MSVGWVTDPWLAMWRLHRENEIPRGKETLPRCFVLRRT